MPSTLVYIGLGSNLAHPRRQLARAMKAIGRLPRTHIVDRSRNYVTAPLDPSEPQPDFVNAVVALRTTLRPRALLSRLQAIERRQHRRRDAAGPRHAARTLDLDLLLYGRRRIQHAQLMVPHPRMHERAFALRPLYDVAPSVTIPGRGLAHRHWRAVRGQAVAPTRTHILR